MSRSRIAARVTGGFFFVLCASLVVWGCDSDAPTGPRPEASGTPELAVTGGTFTAYPGQAAINQTAVQQPINANGSSNFKYNGKSVIPVKFQLLTGLGPFVFESIYANNGGATPDSTDDFSFVTFTPTTPFPFSDLSNLTSVYSFTLGDCHGGSLRWSVRIDVNNDGITSNDHTIFIYYGLPPNLGNGGDGGCTSASTGGASQTNVNLLSLGEQGIKRFDVLQFGGPFYGDYNDALAATSNGACCEPHWSWTRVGRGNRMGISGSPSAA